MKTLIAAAILATATTPSSKVEATAAAPAAGAEERAQVAALVAKVQAFYEASQGFDTRFEQRFNQAGIPSRFAGAAATGRMRFRKPTGETGPLMRWDYADGRILLLVEDRSWTYDPDTKQATEYRVDPAQLSAAVTFMWGKGKLDEEFEIARSSRKLGEGEVLELKPRKAGGGFSKVFLLVDPATGMVQRSVVVQTNGSENDLRFVEAKVNATLKTADFDPASAFPEGTSRVRAALPGR